MKDTTASLFAVALMASAGGSLASPVVTADPSAFSGEVTSAYPGLALSRIDVVGEMSETTITVPIMQSSAASYPVFSNGQYFGHTGSFSLLWSLYMGTALRVDFSLPVDFVSVEFAPDDSDSGVLQAYASDGDLLAEVTNRSSSPFVLSHSGLSSPISYVIATYGDTGRLGKISYQMSSIPEPATIGLVVLGLAGLGFVKRPDRLSRAARPVGEQ